MPVSDALIGGSDGGSMRPEFGEVEFVELAEFQVVLERSSVREAPSNGRVEKRLRESKVKSARSNLKSGLAMGRAWRAIMHCAES